MKTAVFISRPFSLLRLLFNLNNSKSGVMFLEHHPAAVCGADAPVEKAVKVDCRSFCQITRTVLTFFAG